jgi:ATPase family associated with various cellular activities (AAA)
VDRLLTVAAGNLGTPPALDSPPAPTSGRIDRLTRAFSLNDLERSIVLLCLAPEIDRKYERIYAWLQDDVQAIQPTVGLALSLFRSDFASQISARSVFDDPDAPLLHSILAPMPEGAVSLLARRLCLNRRIVSFLLGNDDLDVALRDPVPLARWFSPTAEPPIWSQFHEEQLRALDWRPPEGDWCCLLSGSRGAGKKTFAQAVCRRRGLPLLVCDLVAAATAGKTLDTVLPNALREVTLYAVPLYLETSADTLPTILHFVEHWPGLVFLAKTEPWRAERPRRPCVEVAFGVLEEAQRQKIWMRHVDSSETANRLASLYRFVPGQIEEAAAHACEKALLRGEPRAADADFLAACRALSSSNLVSFAVKVPLRRGWDDLVLARLALDQLHELCDQVRFHSRVFNDWGFQAKAGLGCGLLALFSGPSGTGKTLAAEVIAGALGLDLFKIDLSSLVSKYIGETEKNLARVFEDGDRSGGILFFDEADAVFGKRTDVRDAHDRYANLEVNYLLQRIEDYPGVVILASNMGRNIDSAFQRRMNFVVEFPFPDADHRRRIWQTVFPSTAPLEPSIDFDFLAEHFNLAGGNIRNIAIAAAFHAACNGGSINMHHLLRGLKREYQKMGKVCERAEFGEYYAMVR